VSETGLYFVQAETECGVALDSIEITFKDCSAGIYVPNAFSPNYDARNDAFKAYTQNMTVLEMEIYDRWGNMVYGSKGVSPMWDGVFRGKPANSAVYVYRIRYRNDLTGEEDYLVGDVTLVR
jgi:gliding motility-associated-like protein